MVTGPRPKIAVTGSAQLEDLRREAGGRVTEQRVESLLGHLREAPVQYEFPSWYLGSITAQLQDSGVLAEESSGLDYELSEHGPSLVRIIPRQGTRLEKLTPEEFDLVELRREFHGGGSLSDPLAAEAMLSAIAVLRQNLSALHEDEALLIRF